MSGSVHAVRARDVKNLLDRRVWFFDTTEMDVMINDWIRREGNSFSLNSSAEFNSAVDAVIRSLGESVELLGFGEALHGGEEILLLRNRLFQRLVEAHGYTAIAIESGFE